MLAAASISKFGELAHHFRNPVVQGQPKLALRTDLAVLTGTGIRLEQMERRLRPDQLRRGGRLLQAHRVVIGTSHEHRDSQVLRVPIDGVVAQLIEPVEVRLGVESPQALVNNPLEAAGRQAAVVDGQRVRVEGGLVARLVQLDQLRGEELLEHLLQVVQPVHEGHAREAPVHGSGAHGEDGAERVAVQDQLVRVDVVAGVEVVDDGGHDGVPVRDEAQPLLAAHGGLAWPLVGDEVVSAACGLAAYAVEQVLLAAVVAAARDDSWAFCRVDAGTPRFL